MNKRQYKKWLKKWVRKQPCIFLDETHLMLSEAGQRAVVDYFGRGVKRYPVMQEFSEQIAKFAPNMAEMLNLEQRRLMEKRCKATEGDSVDNMYKK